MKNWKSFMAVMLGLLLIFIFTGCLPTGGTLTLVNETKYVLNKVNISFGNSEVDKLLPGEWMKASVDKNRSANVRFSIGSVFDKPENWVEIPDYGINFWLANRATSNLIEVHNGESVIVYVREIQTPAGE